MVIDRRAFLKNISIAAAGVMLPAVAVRAKTFLTVEQARKILWGDTEMQPVIVELTEEQMDAIHSASDTRVRSDRLQAWRTASGGWFIVDQIIGKHENIDMAFALNHEGKVKGLEILTYRETYGYEVQNLKWRAQFHGKDHSEILRLDHQIKNISGATLSCRHITDGINRLTHTWHQVLQYI
mgnify:FL=1